MNPALSLTSSDLLQYTGLMLSFDIVIFTLFYGFKREGLIGYIRKNGSSVFAILTIFHTIAVLAVFSGQLELCLGINIFALGLIFSSFFIIGIVQLNRGLSLTLMKPFMQLISDLPSERPLTNEEIEKLDEQVMKPVVKIGLLIIKAAAVIVLIAFCFVGVHFFAGDFDIEVGWVVGVLSSLLFALYTFGTPLPLVSWDRIKDEGTYSKKLVELCRKANNTIYCSTTGFSSIISYKQVEQGLYDASIRGVQIAVLGLKEKMHDDVIKKLFHMGVSLYFTDDKYLDMQGRFWNHIFLVDDLHWLWLFPHESGQKFHQGYWTEFDIKTSGYLEHLDSIPKEKYPQAKTQFCPLCPSKMQRAPFTMNPSAGSPSGQPTAVVGAPKESGNGASSEVKQ